MATMADAADELSQLMPRTNAVNEQADVDIDRLKEYIAAAQHDPALTVSQRTSVMIRTDVRKDADGFEDIDDFWAEEDVAGDKDDTEGEDSSILSEGVASSANLSMVSAASEREVNLSGLDAASSDEDMDLDAGHSDTMELESQASQRGDDHVEAATAKQMQTLTSTPKKSAKAKDDATLSVLRQSSEHTRKSTTPTRQLKSRGMSTPVFDNADTDFSFGEGGGSPVSSGRKSLLGLATPAKSKLSSKQSSPVSSGRKAAQKKKMRRETRDSFGGDGGFDDFSSPFSIHDAVLTPLSNASEKNLPSIKPFSENGSSANSPNIRVNLFKSKEKSADAWDGDNITKRVKKAKPDAAKQTKASKAKTRRFTYKSMPASETSFGDELTDNDDGSFLDNSRIATDDNDSDWDQDKSTNLSKARNGRDGDLSYADEILKDAGDDGEGLRRSKRKRYKPLAWYKGEHYVYERRQSGVGLVIPTVAAIERVGTTTPMKKTRAAPKKTNALRTLKPFSRDKLPKDLTIDDGEWADLWDVSAQTMNKMNVVCRFEEIEHRELPAVNDLPPGTAGQSFNLRNPSPTARWIAGHLGLVPGAAKEAETVGDAAQVFTVLGGQPQALEVAIGPAQDGVFDPESATRFVLNPKDQFYIPAQNAYYLKNHSETATTELLFMILKPDTRMKGPHADTEDSVESTTPKRSESRSRKRTKT